MSMSRTTKLITPDQIAEYENSGFLDFDNLFTTDEIGELYDRISAIADGALPDYPTADIELEPGADGVRSLKTVRKINRCVENDPVFLRYAKTGKVLDVVEALLGPDIKLFGSQAFMKPPGGVEKPHHQDSPYFPIEPMALTTCWIALDDVTIDNGCLWVIPGSHRLGPLAHDEDWIVGDREDMRIPESAIDRSMETPVTLTRGSCSFHHSLLVHMSHPNGTQHPRRGLAFHYMTSKSKWTDPSRPQPKYTLLRGRAYTGCV